MGDKSKVRLWCFPSAGSPSLFGIAAFWDLCRKFRINSALPPRPTFPSNLCFSRTSYKLCLCSQLLRCLFFMLFSYAPTHWTSAVMRSDNKCYPVSHSQTFLFRIFFHFSPTNLKVQTAFPVLLIRILLYLVAHIFNTSTWETAAGGFPWVWGQP